MKRTTIIYIISICVISTFIYIYLKNKSNYIPVNNLEFTELKNTFQMKLESNINLNKLDNYVFEAYKKNTDEKFLLINDNGYINIPIKYENCYIRIYKDNTYNSEYVLTRKDGYIFIKFLIHNRYPIKSENRGLELYYNDRQSGFQGIPCACS
jgi:hypothetical protein